jgi:hypothetical protein
MIREGGNTMRALLLAAPLALGLGLFTSGSMAAPASGISILEAVAKTSVVEQARWHWRWRRHCHHGRWSGVRCG